MHRRTIAVALLFAFTATQTGCMTAFAAFQPENVGGETIVLISSDAEGESYERVLSPIDEGDQLFIAANHWPRAWYNRVLENPEVSVRRGEETRDYTATPVSEEERERLLDHPGFPAVAYLFTGFAPRKFLRLDPR